MNINVFLITCIISLTSFSNIAHSLNDMYVDEPKVKECLNTIESLRGNYIKHIL